MSTHRKNIPIENRKTSGDYLKYTDVEMAKKVVQESKDLPHLAKQKIKYILKN